MTKKRRRVYLILPWFLLGVLVLQLETCVSPPKHANNICKIFSEKPNWYRQAKKSELKWGSKISMMMAIMYQESAFVANAKPPREKILWVLPGPRKSTAFGYAQARNATWDWYKKDTDSWAVDRESFSDAIDFVGWYNTKSRKLSKIGMHDTYSHYLAYHEGQTGFNRKSFNSKKWLLGVARKVERRAKRFQQQMNGCEAELQSNNWWPF